MNFKYILENLETGDKVPVRTLRAIADLLHIDYHQARTIHQQTINSKKFLHPQTAVLCSKYKIHNNF
jgi:hypothetical protein